MADHIYKHVFKTRKDGIFSGMFPCNLKDTHLNSEDFLCITNKELAHNLEWDYDATLVDTPYSIDFWSWRRR